MAFRLAKRQTERVDTEQAFAIFRIDAFQDTDDTRYTVKRVVWEQDQAESEVERLNQLNGDKGCRYGWQVTRVDRR